MKKAKMESRPMPAVLFSFFLLNFSFAVHGGDWPQWGGTHDRNMASKETNLPDSWSPGKKKDGTEEWDLSTAKNPVYVVNPKYDAKMLIRAICKIENFRYQADGRWHGVSSEHHFLYVTTSLLNQQHLDSLSEELGHDDALLIYCTRLVSGIKVPDSMEVKKIPRDLLAKCTFEEGRA